jgi:hypothetical protein
MKVLIGPEEIQHPSEKNEMGHIQPPVMQTVKKKGVVEIIPLPRLKTGKVVMASRFSRSASGIEGRKLRRRSTIATNKKMEIQERSCKYLTR